MMMGQVRAVALRYTTREGRQPLLGAKMSSYEGQSAGHPTRAERWASYTGIANTLGFCMQELRPMISNQLTRFQLAHRYKFGLEGHSRYPKSPGAVPLPPSHFSPAAEAAGGGSAGTPLPPHCPAMGRSTQDEAPQSRFMGLRRKPGRAESGGRRKATPLRQGKAGLKYERAWSQATAHWGLRCSTARDSLYTAQEIKQPRLCGPRCLPKTRDATGG